MQAPEGGDGKTTLENLGTLWEPCNLGKSNVFSKAMDCLQRDTDLGIGFDFKVLDAFSNEIFNLLPVASAMR